MENTKQAEPEANLPPPIVASLLPDDLQWDERGLLPAKDAWQLLPIEIPSWTHNPLPALSTTLRLYWTTGVTTQLVEQREWLSDLYPQIPPDELKFEVPASLLAPGSHQLWYDLTTPNGGFYESDRQTITIDVSPPIFGANQGALIFDTVTIDEQYLMGHGDQALAQVPAYSGFKPGDVITWYWNRDPFNVALIDVVDARTLYCSDTQPLSVAFTGDMIRDRGDGERYAFYQLADRAGNITGYSQSVRLTVSVQAPPRYLPSPTVAKAVGSGTSSILNPFEARAGATVVIPQDAVLDPGDVLSVQWAAPGVEGAFLATVADVTGKRFTIPENYIAQHMGKHIPVYYLVDTTPAQKSVEHDLTVAVMDSSRWRTIQCTRPQGVGTRLSLGAVDTFATFQLDRWTFMAPGQRVTITLSGSGQSQVVLNDYPLVPNDVSEGAVAVNVQKTVLQGFTVNQALNVLVKVSFDGGASTVNFPSLNLTLTV